MGRKNSKEKNHCPGQKVPGNLNTSLLPISRLSRGKAAALLRNGLTRTGLTEVQGEPLAQGTPSSTTAAVGTSLQPGQAQESCWQHGAAPSTAAAQHLACHAGTR